MDKKLIATLKKSRKVVSKLNVWLLGYSLLHFICVKNEILYIRYSYESYELLKHGEVSLSLFN